MSYARFSDSDVYVFDVVHGGWTCCGCFLVGHFNSPTRSGMVAHMRDHEAAGHDTGKVIERLLEEKEAYGDEWEPRR